MRRYGSNRWAVVAAGVILVGMSSFAALGQCYDDVDVSGAGIPGVNGTYEYTGLQSGYPRYDKPGSTAWIFRYDSGLGIWLWCITWDYYGRYYSAVDSPVPPSTGWFPDSTEGALPVPDVTGGGLVADTTPPVLTVPPDVTVACDDPKDPGSTGWATATDNCDPSPVVTYSDGGGYGAQGFILRRWEAEDAAGNFAQSDQRIWILSPDVTIGDLAPLWLTSLPGTVSLQLTIEKCADEAHLYAHGIGWTDYVPVISDGVSVNTLPIEVPLGSAEGLYPISSINLRHVSPFFLMPYHTSLSFGVDLTPPIFTDCPEDLEVDAPPGAVWATVDWIEPMASDAVSGLHTVGRTHAPSDAFPIGTTTVTYTATDVAGHTSTCSFDITVSATCDIITPMGVVGFLDRGMTEGEEPPIIGELPLLAVYEAGELIEGCFLICTVLGEIVDEPSILTFYQVAEIGEEFDVRLPLDARYLYFNADTGLYCFTIDTEGLEAGYHDIRLGFPDGEVQWLRVEVVLPEA